MGVGLLLVGLVGLVTGGLFLGLLLSYREVETERAAVEKEPPAEAAGFFAWRGSDPALVEELMLRRLEHHLRRELQAAELFIDDPTPQRLRAGCQSRLELH